MPLLGALLSTLAAGFGALLAKVFAARIAIRLAGVAALATIVGALMVAFNTVVAPLAAATFSTQYGWTLGLAFPPVSGTCMAAITATWAACQLYAFNRRAVQMAAGA